MTQIRIRFYKSDIRIRTKMSRICNTASGYFVTPKCLVLSSKMVNKNYLQGFCHLGQCEKSNPDHIVRIIDIFKDISLTSILKFLKDNVVGTVIFVSLLFWVPLSCLISWVDRKRADQAAADWEWRRQDELIHPSDKRRIIHLRVPKRSTNSTAAAGGSAGGGAMDQQTPEHRDLVHRNVVHQSAM
jgi:hypothetical protein